MTQTEIEIGLPKVINEKHQTSEGGHCLGVFTNKVITVMAWTTECLCDMPKVENQSYKAIGHQASTEDLCLVRPLFKH